MKLTPEGRRRAHSLPAGKTDVIDFDDSMPGFGYRLRIGAGGKVLRSWVCQYRHGGATRRLLLGCGRRCSVPSRRAPWPRRRWAASPMARTRRRTSSTAAARTSIRSRPPSPITWPIKQREVRPRTYTELVRYLTGKRISGRCTASRSIRSPARTLPAG